MSKYVMGDVHGDSKRFFEMLKTINFSSKDELYMVGDVLDRGNGSFEIYDYIMKKKNIFMVLGNHEIAFLNTNRCIEEEKWEELNSWKGYWFEGDGEQYYTQIFGEWEKEKRQKYIDYLKTCPIDILTKCGRNYHYIVHAGISNDVFEKVQDRHLIFELANGHYSVFVRPKSLGLYEVAYGNLNEDEKGKKMIDNWVINPTIWFGHNPTTYNFNTTTLWKKRFFRDIDCGCTGYSNKGKLCCVRLLDEKVFYL